MGSGYRTFTAGEVLTASNVQNYLQDQAVMVFGGSAARSSAIGTANFEEGMTSYLTDTDQLEVYNGTNWVGVAPTTQGLTLISTTSFTSVAAMSLNNIFSSTYDKYIIGITAANSASANLRFRFRESGANITTGYYGAGWEYDYAGGSGVKNARNNGSEGDMGQLDTTLSSSWWGCVTAEKGAGGTLRTQFYGQGQGAASPINFGYQTADGSADGISFFGTSGNMSGFVTVWGMAR
jgi:hypothetical protein